MKDILRALMLSALVTGAAALLVYGLQRDTRKDRLRRIEEQDKFVDADKFTDEEKKQLTDELGWIM